MNSDNPSQSSRGTQATHLGQSTVHYHTNPFGNTNFYVDTNGEITVRDLYDTRWTALTGLVGNIIKYAPEGDDDAKNRLSKRAFANSTHLASKSPSQPLKFIHHDSQNTAREACESNASGRNFLRGFIDNQSGFPDHYPNITMDPTTLGFTKDELVNDRIPVELISGLVGEGDDCDKESVADRTEISNLGRALANIWVGLQGGKSQK